MDCGDRIEFGFGEHVDRIAQRAFCERVPVSGSFDLTYRCNLRCRHCYGAHLVAQPSCDAAELKTAEVVRLLEQAAAEGCLFALLSGGEPLLRDDFVDIYTAAARLGLVVTVYTNATLVRPIHLEAFAAYPPHLVEVSIYGATEATYDKVTGVAGSYRRAWRGIRLLMDHGVRVGLKTMILTDNIDEVPAMEAIAEEFGLEFRMDPLVTPRLDGDPAPLAQRVDPDRAIEVELRSEGRRAKTAEFVEGRLLSEQACAGDPSRHRLYRCGAGAVGFHVDPRGIVRPCLMSRDLGYNGAQSGFAAAWESVVAATDLVTSDKMGACTDCPHILLCGYCPALFALEQGSLTEPANYVCKLGESRHRVVSWAGPEVEHVR